MNTLTEDDVHELANPIAKVAQDNLATLNIQQVNIADQVGNRLNKLIYAINEVKSTVEAETYSFDPNVTLATPDLVPPIKVKILRRALETVTETSAVDDNSSLQIDFSKLALSEVYKVQQEAASEICLRENFVAYQATKQGKVKAHKALLRDKE